MGKSAHGFWTSDGKDGFTPQGFDYYVDSVNGSDSNDGLSRETAFATIAALEAAISGDYSGLKIGLARGSSWKEQITGSGNNAEIVAYGTGTKPVLDATNAMTNASFSLSGGTTNVYEYSLSHQSAAASGKTSFSVFEDDARLTRVADVATCDSTAGSFYAPDPIASTVQTLYVHPTGSTNPTSDGKVYAASVRDYGIVGGSGWVVSGVRTKRQVHADGSIVLGSNSIATSCICEDGTVHNCMIASGYAYDCIFSKGELFGGSGTSTLFVAYAADASANAVTLRKCIFIGNDTSTTGQVGAYCHGSSPAYYGSISIEDCSFYGLDAAFSGVMANASTLRNRATGCAYFSSPSPTVSYSSIDDWMDAASVSATIQPQRVIYCTTDAAYTVNGLRIAARQTNGAAVWFSNGTASVTNSVFAFVNVVGFPYSIRSDAGSVTMSGVISYNPYAYVQEGAGVTLTSDNNVIYPSTTAAVINGTTYATVAEYISATSQDANSVSGDPLLNDPANGDFGVSASSPAIAIGAGLERPSVTYTAIPSDVAIAAL